VCCVCCVCVFLCVCVVGGCDAAWRAVVAKRKVAAFRIGMA